MNVPNTLTLVRIALTPWVGARLLTGDCRGALWLLGVAGFTDGLDGYLARRFGWMTRFGAYLDPIADKFLLITVYVSLGLAGIVPAWLAVLVVGRDILILLMAGAGLLFTRYREFPPSIWGKISTFVQIVTGLAAVGTCTAGFSLPAALIWLTAATTAGSGIHYIARGLRMLMRGAGQP